MIFTEVSFTKYDFSTCTVRVQVYSVSNPIVECVSNYFIYYNVIFTVDIYIPNRPIVICLHDLYSMF